tara:strand:- start:167 stop:469 length:303 start_codon:yes stop_codon:yes gene_type:complete
MEHTHEYLQYLREQEHCSLCYKETPTEPHHIDQVGMGRNRAKPLRVHYTAIPVCRICHAEYHQLGKKMYSIKHQVNPYEIALYWLSKFLIKERYGSSKKI